MNSLKKINCIQLNLTPVINHMQIYINESMKTYADELICITKQLVYDQSIVINELKKMVDFDIVKSQKDFENLLNGLKKTRKDCTNIEHCFHNINYYLYILEQAKMTMPSEDLSIIAQLQDDWIILQNNVADKCKYLDQVKIIWSYAIAIKIRSFFKDLEQFIHSYKEYCLQRSKDDLNFEILLIEEHNNAFAYFMERKQALTEAEEIYSLNLLQTEHFDNLYNEFQNIKIVCNLYKKQKYDIEKWSKLPWTKIDIDFVREIFGALMLQFKRLPTLIRNTQPAFILKRYLSELRQSIPIFLKLKSKDLKPRHWKEMLETIDLNTNCSEDVLSFGTIMKMQVVKNKNVILRVLEKATNESDIENQLKIIKIRWNTINLKIEQSTTLSKIDYHLQEVEDILQLLENDQIIISKIMNNNAVEPFLITVENSRKKLSTINEVLNKWWSLQQKLISLAEIYLNKELKTNFTEEVNQVKDFLKLYRNVMIYAYSKKRVNELCFNTDISNQILWLEENIGFSKKTLKKFALDKRNLCPRFYFLSDDKLLQIYGSLNPFDAQEIIIQVFNNIKCFLFQNHDETFTITAIKSCEDEILTLKNVIAVQNSVDHWLPILINEIHKTHHFLVKNAIFELGTIFNSNEFGWIKKFQGSVCLVADYVWWTIEVQNTFRKIQLGEKLSMRKYLNQLKGRLKEIGIALNDQIIESDRKKLNSLLLSFVHQKDTIEFFVNNNITSISDFEWDCTLKYYWLKSENNLFFSQCSEYFQFGHEYMGSNRNLLITPLTNRIYLTFTQALKMNVGGALIGNSGTGKLQTILTMSKLFGQLCKVITCSDQLNHEIFEQFLIGICKSKVWGLFQNFNKINQKTVCILSTLFSSLKCQLLTNENISKGCSPIINLNCGIFLTMNIEKPNKNSTKIDEIIKNNFRPASLIVPDFQQICLTMLYSVGLLKAKVLSKKITLLYKLCKAQLSTPFNFIFNLRSLKALISFISNINNDHSDFKEKDIVAKALKDFYLPQLNENDKQLFLSFLSDLFPKNQHFTTNNLSLKVSIEKIIAQGNYKKIDNQIEKIIDSLNVIKYRNSLALIGPTCGGKSTILKIICEALSDIEKVIQLTTIHPNAFTISELYGYIDTITRDWKDGLLTYIFRKINQPIIRNNIFDHFILFDGSLDLLWIHELNSVIDDNKTLILNNGEQIRIRPQCKLLFEVGNLNYSTPSTISRMSLIFIDPNDLGYEPYWDCWLKSKNLMEQTAMDQCFHKYVPELLKLIFGEKCTNACTGVLSMAVHQTKLNLVTQLCFILDVMLPLVSSNNKSTKTSFEKRMSLIEDSSSTPLHSMATFIAGVDMLEAVFIQALYLSLGASLADDSSQYAFDASVKKLTGFPLFSINEDQSKLINLKYIPCGECTWYDYYLDFNKLEWISWEKVVPVYSHKLNFKFNEILIPTVSTTKFIWLLQLINEFHFRSVSFKKVKRPTILVGRMGSGKSALLQYFLYGLSSLNFMKRTLNFSTKTSSIEVQNSLKTNLEQRSQNVLGPPVGKRLVYFIDDLNLPHADELGTQTPIAFLKSIFDKQGIYDQENYFRWNELVDICFFAAMGYSGGSRNILDPRFLSLCSIFNLPSSSDDTIKHIFHTILSIHVENFTEDVRNAVKNIINMTIGLYNVVLEKLHPTPERYLYLFNINHISQIIHGMTRISPEVFTTIELFVRVWRNEITRVMCDRLINQQDKDIFDFHLKQELKLYFPQQLDYVLRDPLLFGDCRNAVDSKDNSRKYEDLIDYDSVYHLFQEILTKYNTTYGLLDMILFNNSLDHIIRIHRVLRMNKGHVILIGPSGNGKSSLSKLSSYTSGYTMFFYKCHKTDDSKTFEQHFKETLHQIFCEAGIKNQPTILILDDIEIIEENILEFINNILITGFVPSLYSDKEKKKKITEELKKKFDNSHPNFNANSYWDFFLTNCYNNLHLILLMEPGSNLKLHFRNFPGLLNKTYINWIHDWPVQALKAVAERIVAYENIVPDKYICSILKQSIYTHQSADNYAKLFNKETSKKIRFSLKHLIDFMTIFKDLTKKRSAFLCTKVYQISLGLKNIEHISQEVIKLNEIILHQKEKISQQNLECSFLNEEIMKTCILIENQKKNLFDCKKELQCKTDIIKTNLQQLFELDQKMMPILNNFKTSLNDLKSENFEEIKLIDTPSESLIELCECIAIIKSYEDFNTRKTLSDMVGEPGFLESLCSLDFDQISHRQRIQLQDKMKIINKNITTRDISTLENSLFRFIKSIEEACFIRQKMISLKSKIKKLEEDFDENKQIAKTEDDKLNNFQNKLLNLQEHLEKYLNEIKNLKYENVSLEKKFNIAKKLLEELNLKTDRYILDQNKYELMKEETIGNSLICASFLIYAGPFSLKYRTNMIYNDWINNALRLKIPLDINLKIENELASDVEIANWTLNGLQSNEYFTQNAIIITQCFRYPLCIDPQNLITNWIANHEKKNSLMLVSFIDCDYLNNLKKAIQNGLPIIFTDFENIDIDIKNILNKNIKSNSNNCLYIEVNDEHLEYNEQFRLYLMTKLTDQQFSSNVYSLTTVVNCSITQKGMEDYFLDIILKNENNEYVEKMKKTLSKDYECRKYLQELENTYLEKIMSYESSFIDNSHFVDELKNIKSQLNLYCSEKELVFKAKSENEKLRTLYKTISELCALYYKILYDLRNVDTLYQFSLQFYEQLLIRSIKLAPQDKILSERIFNILQQLTNYLLEFSCFSIFEKHKLLFLFEMSCITEKYYGNLSDSEIIFFIKGSLGSLNVNLKNPTSWLPNKCWQNLVKLSLCLSNFSNLTEHFQKNTKEWKEWYYLEYPEDLNTTPIKINKYFDMLLLLRCFRTDRLYQGVKNYVHKVINTNNHNIMNIGNKCFELLQNKFSNFSSCVLVLNYKSDCLPILLELAKKNSKDNFTYDVLTSAVSEESVIFTSLNSAMDKGNWLILQNFNFTKSFILKIQYILYEKNQPCHPNFKLWVLLEPLSIIQYPSTFLLRSLKVIIEPPKSTKTILMNALKTVDLSDLEYQSRHPCYRSLLFALLFLHGILLERKKYNKIGWNVSYSFDFLDIKMCQQILDMYLSNTYLDEIPWIKIKTLIGEIVYGGKIVNNYDNRVLLTYIEEYLGEFIYSTYQPFSFFKCDNKSKTSQYHRMERLLLQNKNINLFDIVDKIPTTINPDTCGLHPNAMYVYNNEQIAYIWRNMMKLYPNISTVKNDNNYWCEVVNYKKEKIFNSLPSLYDMNKVRSFYENKKNNPSIIVLFQELQHFNILLETIRNGLTKLQMVFLGKLEMDSELEDVYSCLYLDLIPKSWKRISSLAIKSLSRFLDHINQRNLQYSTWSNK
ncbi:dynein axonemal heavy chain 10-like isoform X2 [Daktulosphaira vitifoliae]|uniref:dynein axonemal heavy chain 10-like isoform X2 n=1 Tax=Daktulosphaira vitifoliae TaxID=58002 RepID=UPI0021AA7BE5|nr:dynein axonemal heavy chain 10-like isoform X2 [Daktulosphaira vitifoliae]